MAIAQDAARSGSLPAGVVESMTDGKVEREIEKPEPWLHLISGESARAGVTQVFHERDAPLTATAGRSEIKTAESRRGSVAGKK